MISVRPYSLEYTKEWDNLLEQSVTATWFQTASWVNLWQRHFDGDSIILGVYLKDKLIGIATLKRDKDLITFYTLSTVVGGEEITDYGDIVAIKGREKEVWEAVLKNINPPAGGQIKYNFKFIREESPSFQILKDLGGKIEESDVSPYIELPNTWEEYLTSLDRHDRHELRRKIKRLEEEGAFKVCHAMPAGRQDGEPSDIDEFFRLMSLSNDQKRDFLTREMKSFFRDIFATFWPKKLMYLCFMKLDRVNIAASLLFDFRGEILLYNSGYDPAYGKLSPGFLLKAFLIRNAIEEKKKKFDFLRGSERYKYDLGGKEQKLYTLTL